MLPPYVLVSIESCTWAKKAATRAFAADSLQFLFLTYCTIPVYTRARTGLSRFVNKLKIPLQVLQGNWGKVYRELI